jgi:hypothetical protein
MSVDDSAWELNVVWFDAAKQNGDASSRRDMRACVDLLHFRAQWL